MEKKCNCNKGLYVCGFCGTSHKTVEQRMACEAKCSKENEDKKKENTINSLKEKITEYQSQYDETVKSLKEINNKLTAAKSSLNALCAEKEEPKKKRILLSADELEEILSNIFMW